MENRPCGVVLQMTGSARGPLRYGAEHGFLEMTVPMLSDLYDIVGLAAEGGAKPIGQAAFLHALLRHAMPEKADAEIEAIVASRGKCQQQEAAAAESELLNNLKAGDEVETDMGDLVKLKKKTAPTQPQLRRRAPLRRPRTLPEPPGRRQRRKPSSP